MEEEGSRSCLSSLGHLIHDGRYVWFFLYCTHNVHANFPECIGQRKGSEPVISCNSSASVSAVLQQLKSQVLSLVHFLRVVDRSFPKVRNSIEHVISGGVTCENQLDAVPVANESYKGKSMQYILKPENNLKYKL